jgi:hypothetical protein
VPGVFLPGTGGWVLGMGVLPRPRVLLPLLGVLLLLLLLGVLLLLLLGG